MYWYFVAAGSIFLDSGQVPIGFLAILLVVNVGNKVSEGFSLGICDFSP